MFVLGTCKGNGLQFSSRFSFQNIYKKTLHHKPHQNEKQIFFFPNTTEKDFNFYESFSIILDLNQLGTKTLKGGFRRRPELIKSRLPNWTVLPSHAHIPPVVVKHYGLLDKCERIQREMTTRLLQLMTSGGQESGSNKWIADIGCGHGWSLTIPVSRGFCVTAIDLDFRALSVVWDKVRCCYLPPAQVQIVRADLSQGFCFKENIFDFAISVSFLQWLCVGKDVDIILEKFFTCLQRILKPSGVAGIQLYPRNVEDLYKVVSHAQNYFRGVLLSDYPHVDRGRKLFLVLRCDKL